MLHPDLVKRPRFIFVYIAVVLILSAIVFSRKSRASSNVDLVLLLALDVSASIDNSEYLLMRDGLANALSSVQVEQAITSGKIGAIAISVMQWSGFQEQEVKITWIRVASRADLTSLSNQIRNMPRRYKGGATDIGGAIKFSRDYVHSAPFETPRKTIDIAGDGFNNVNESPSFERDITVKSGITINGLSIIGEAITLVDFYTKFVIGGNAAFVEDARDYDGFETAMRRKLLREIGSLYLF